MRAFNVRVEGRVQGVGFRYYTQQEANRLGIHGWVKNFPDGSVETLICGGEDELNAMLAWLKHGPSSAMVTQTHIEPTSLDPNLTGFNIACSR
ncbi:MAG: acylphosphatase [Mariprofundaceae bacterium]